MTSRDIMIIGLALLAYALVSRRMAGTAVSAPMVFVAIGFVVGPRLLDLVELGIGSEDLGRLAEVTLALVLFTDATAIDTRRLRREDSMPIRLLGLALPLTIIAGSLLAVVLFPDLVVFEAVALAVLLAPTDAALGQPVVSDPRIPSVVRQGLNVESGLNDGVCVPLLLSAVAFAELEEAPSFDGGILVDLVRELTIAVGVGALIAVAVGGLVRWSTRRGWLAEGWAVLIPLVTAVLAYVATAEAGGSGFIASFVAGLVYGRLLGAAAHQSAELTDDLGHLLSGVTFFLFGAVLVSTSIDGIDLETVLYAVASLTVIRMVPVALALAGSGAERPTVAFAGWFGPRGLATIVFALTVIETSGLTGATRIVEVATLTVLLSVFAHGVTAAVLSDRYVRWFDRSRSRLTFETAPVEIGSHVRIPRPSQVTPDDRGPR
ncbi:MAG TPA: cation:proton antiporter [Ilumatobacter sp.]|nr:cation:proton antiporter [Ilumatobacter sp.]